VDTDEIELHKGELGGWLEKESNLSQEGLCWVAETCAVMGNIVIQDKVFIELNSVVSGVGIIGGDGCIQESKLHNVSTFGGWFAIEAMYIQDCIFNGEIELVRGNIKNCEITQIGEKSISLIDCTIKNKHNSLLIENDVQNGLELQDVHLSFSSLNSYNTPKELLCSGSMKHVFAENLTTLSLTGELKIEQLMLDECSVLINNSKSLKNPITIRSLDFKNGVLKIEDVYLSGEDIVIEGNVILSNVKMGGFSSILNQADSPVVLKNVELYDCSQVKRIRNNRKALDNCKLYQDEMLVM